ncbi:MAG TPA: PEP-CTERM sorting domain-containing protein [Pirellulaceae bacterium]|jgi:hypothetical protein
MYRNLRSVIKSRSFALCAVVVTASLVANSAGATVLYSTTFTSPTYSNGALAPGAVNTPGQDGWSSHSGTGTNAQTVSLASTQGVVTLTTSGEDTNHPFAAVNTVGTVFLDADFTVNSAQAAGDYFLHLGDGGSSNFNGRIYAKSSGAGYVMAVGTGSTIPPAANFGTTVLAFGTEYHLLMKYNMVAGLANDNGALYINPTEIHGIGNTPYVNAFNTGVDAVKLAGVYMRQGSATAAPGVIIDNLAVSVPEPATLVSLLSGGLIGLVALRRRLIG